MTAHWVVLAAAALTTLVAAAVGAALAAFELAVLPASQLFVPVFRCYSGRKREQIERRDDTVTPPRCLWWW